MRRSEFSTLVKVSKIAGRAIMEYNMIQKGDRIAVAVSGGKDSLSMLHILRHRQRISPVPFDITAVHVDYQMEDFDPRVLVEYFKRHEFPYIVKKVEDFQGQRDEDINCFWWSRHRRKSLFQLAEQEGYSKIAFGHHMDDIVETIILNQFFRGEVGAMKPKQELFEGRITIIRPLAYIREDQMRQLAQELHIDAMGQSRCANDDTSYRMKIKDMIKEFERDNPAISKNIFNSLQNVKTEYLLETQTGSTKLLFPRKRPNLSKHQEEIGAALISSKLFIR